MLCAYVAIGVALVLNLPQIWTAAQDRTRETVVVIFVHHLLQHRNAASALGSARLSSPTELFTIH